MGAAAKGQGDAVQALMAAGADARATDKDGTSALTYAQKAGHAQVVDMLRTGGAPRAR